MFTSQPTVGRLSLDKCDVMGMVPLHTAALYDQTDIASFFIQQVSVEVYVSVDYLIF